MKHDRFQINKLRVCSSQSKNQAFSSAKEEQEIKLIPKIFILRLQDMSEVTRRNCYFLPSFFHRNSCLTSGHKRQPQGFSFPIRKHLISKRNESDISCKTCDLSYGYSFFFPFTCHRWASSSVTDHRWASSCSFFYHFSRISLTWKCRAKSFYFGVKKVPKTLSDGYSVHMHLRIAFGHGA